MVPCPPPRSSDDRRGHRRPMAGAPDHHTGHNHRALRATVGRGKIFVPRSPVGVVGLFPRDSSYVAHLTPRCSAAILIHSVTFGSDPALRSSAPCLLHMRFLVVKKLRTPPQRYVTSPRALAKPASDRVW